MKNIQFCCHLFCFRCFMPSHWTNAYRWLWYQTTWYGFLHSNHVTFWQHILFMLNIYAASQVACLLLMETILFNASENMQSNEIQFRFCFSPFSRKQLFGFVVFFLWMPYFCCTFSVLVLRFRWSAGFSSFHKLKCAMKCLPVASTIEYDRCIVPNSSRPI